MTYPPGFFDEWTPEQRDEFFADEARRYSEKRAKIDEPQSKAKTGSGTRKANGGGVNKVVVINRVETGGALPPAFSDEALALRFAERHADDLRYVAAWGRWLSWAGTHWQFDDTLHAFDLLAPCLPRGRIVLQQTEDRRVIASAKTVAAVERLAKADRRIAATIDQWDADPWLLNTPGGVIDLRTGQRRPSPDDYLTKITAVAPGGDCPRFLAFLERSRPATPSCKPISAACSAMR